MPTNPPYHPPEPNAWISAPSDGEQWPGSHLVIRVDSEGIDWAVYHFHVYIDGEPLHHQPDAARHHLEVEWLWFANGLIDYGVHTITLEVHGEGCEGIGVDDEVWGERV